MEQFDFGKFTVMFIIQCNISIVKLRLRLPHIYVRHCLLFLLDEKILKLQYQIIGQKLATMKVKKAILMQQLQLGSDINRGGGDVRQCRRQIDNLQQAIDLGEWNDDDKPFIQEQTQNLAGYKRKLEERRDENLLARVQQLEGNMEAEIQRRVALEKRNWEQEKLQYRLRFQTQTQQLEAMMQSVNQTTADLQQVKKGPASKVKRRRAASPQPTTSGQEEPLYIPISDVEPD